MLGQPVAVVAALFGELGEVDTVAQRIALGEAFGNRGLVENAEAHLAGRGEQAGDVGDVLHAFEIMDCF
jgi:hypothetical protein